MEETVGARTFKSPTEDYCGRNLLASLALSDCLIYPISCYGPSQPIPREKKNIHLIPKHIKTLILRADLATIFGSPFPMWEIIWWVGGLVLSLSVSLSVHPSMPHPVPICICLCLYVCVHECLFVCVCVCTSIKYGPSFSYLLFSINQQRRVKQWLSS